MFLKISEATSSTTPHLAFLLTSFFLYFLYKKFTSYLRWKNSPLWKLPGTKKKDCWWLTGNFFAISKSPFMTLQKKWFKEANDIHIPFLHSCMLFGNHTVTVLDADIVKIILYESYAKDNSRFAKRMKVLINILGMGLVTYEGEKWQRHRRIVHPSFQPKLVKEALESTAPGVVKKFIDCWKKAGGNREIDVMTHFSSATLDIIGKAAFSHDFHALDSIEKWADTKDSKENSNSAEVPQMSDRLIVSFGNLFKFTPLRIVLALNNLSWLDRGRNKARAVMKEAVSNILDVARAKNNSHGEKSGDALSLLQVLLKANDTDTKVHVRKRLNDEELQNEIKTFLLAGHETTATLCYWVMYVLCTEHAEIQEKVFADIMKYSSHLQVNEFNIEVVEKMEYFDAFIKEVLRFYPPAGLVIRHTTQDENMKGCLIPKKTRIMIPIYLLHRHPKYWKDPNTFKPERWMEDSHPASHPCAYLPFSLGGRNCIGSQFALWEAKLLIAPILREFSIRIAPSMCNTEFTLTQGITLKTKPRLRICVEKR